VGVSHSDNLVGSGISVRARFDSGLTAIYRENQLNFNKPGLWHMADRHIDM